MTKNYQMQAIQGQKHPFLSPLMFQVSVNSALMIPFEQTRNASVNTKETSINNSQCLPLK